MKFGLGDFQTGDIISWHLLSLAACLAAIWTNETICAWNKGYIFANFAQTPTSTSNLTVSLESQWNVHSNDILSVRKYCQLFTYELNTFLCKKCHSAHSDQQGANAKKSPKQPLPLGAREPHLIHECLGWPHSPRQTTAWSVHALLHNYATNSSLVTMGRPKFTLKTVPSLRRLPPPSKYTHPSTDPTQYPKRHSYPFSRVATIHFPDRQTDQQTHRPTDGLGDRSVTWALTLTI